VDFAAPDLDAIAAAGEHRVRRRRGLGVVAGGLAALAVAATVAVATGGSDDARDAVDPVERPTFPAQVTWVTGSTLHTPDGEQDLGVVAASYVRTTAGLVLADADGGVWSYVDGRTTRVGATDPRKPQLAGDSDGTLAGWIDTSDGGHVPVVLDVATGEPTRFPGRDLADFESFYRLAVVDGRTAYWQERTGWVAADVDTGAVVDVATPGEVLGAEDGVIARADDGVVVSRDGVDRPIPDTWDSTVFLSPDARYLSIEGDELMVYDAETGEPVRTDLSDRWFATGFEWLDDDTLEIVSARGQRAAFELWTCEVTSGACTQVADLGPLASIEDIGLALPSGLPLGG
jgi:hypothetical protein